MEWIGCGILQIKYKKDINFGGPPVYSISVLGSCVKDSYDETIIIFVTIYVNKYFTIFSFILNFSVMETI